ncbi:hypothetical protein [Burkholderia cenocepacia]|uniref:hypothetical protein n=1 Tax=Burkholderia cenocepacia TaxID=95486 RepID=UPI002AB7A61F|nr:hypothetical protein [Burkholderia cenocepacia]
MSLPLPAAGEAVNALMHLVAYAKSNEFAARQHERTLQKALDKGDARPEILWLGLAAAACVLGKPEECVRCVRAALGIAPNDFTVVATAVALYSNIGEMHLAEEQVWQMTRLSEPEDRPSLEVRVNMLRAALNFEDSLDMMRKFGVSEDAQIVQATKRFLELTDKHSLSREVRRELIQTAVGAVRAEKCAIRQTVLDDEYGDGSVRIELFVDETAERCGEVNRAIAEALCEQFDDPMPEVVSFACRPISSFVFQGAFLKVQG